MYVKKIIFYLWRQSGKAEVPKIEQYKGRNATEIRFARWGEAGPWDARGRDARSSTTRNTDGACRRKTPTEHADTGSEREP